MVEENIQKQIDTINHKLDLLLDYVNQQRLRNESTQDLIDDLGIVGKDLYDTAVKELDNQKVEIDPDSIKVFAIKLIKNVDNFHQMLELFESMNDLVKDARPIANEVIIDLSKKMHELDQKGYFEFFKEAGNIFDNVVSHFSADDVRQLADNIVTILETIKNLTQPDMLSAINNASTVFKSMEMKDVPEYSLFKALRELRSPEMKKGIGFMVNFLRNLSENSINKNNRSI